MRSRIERCSIMQDSDTGGSRVVTAKTVAAPIKNPIDMIAKEHAFQLELAKSLEFIADGLPDQVDRRLVKEVVAILSNGLDAHFELEEKVLFPLLRRRAGVDSGLIAALDQLVAEHGRDQDISAELVEELRVLAECGRPRNAEMLGYMLRGYFEGQRRHIEWENAVVLPAARRLLSPEDLDVVARSVRHRPARASV